MDEFVKDRTKTVPKDEYDEAVSAYNDEIKNNENLKAKVDGLSGHIRSVCGALRGMFETYDQKEAANIAGSIATGNVKINPDEIKVMLSAIKAIEESGDDMTKAFNELQEHAEKLEIALEAQEVEFNLIRETLRAENKELTDENKELEMQLNEYSALLETSGKELSVLRDERDERTGLEDDRESMITLLENRINENAIQMQQMKEVIDFEREAAEDLLREVTTERDSAYEMLEAQGRAYLDDITESNKIAIMTNEASSELSEENERLTQRIKELSSQKLSLLSQQRKGLKKIAKIERSIGRKSKAGKVSMRDMQAINRQLNKSNRSVRMLAVKAAQRRQQENVAQMTSALARMAGSTGAARPAEVANDRSAIIAAIGQGFNDTMQTCRDCLQGLRASVATVPDSSVVVPFIMCAAAGLMAHIAMVQGAQQLELSSRTRFVDSSEDYTHAQRQRTAAAMARAYTATLVH